MSSRISGDAKLGEMSMEQEARSKRNRDVSGNSDGAIGDLLDWNNLTYTMPITNSVTVSRNLKRFQADLAAYTDGQTIVFTVQTGAQFVNWRESYLKVDFSVTSDTDNSTLSHFFGSGGSYLSLFRDIIVTSRGGTELQRIERFDVWRSYKDKQIRSVDWFEGSGRDVGYVAQRPLDGVPPLQISFKNNTQRKAQRNVIAGSAPNVTTVRTFIIPMSMLGGIFDSDQLMPSMMSSGMRIEIRLNKALSVLQSYTTATGLLAPLTGALTITHKPVLVCDTHLLNDAATRQLNQTSAQNGLEFVYMGVYSQQESNKKQTNIQVSKAVGAGLATDEAEREYITESEPSSYQWRLGSQYYPFQPIENITEMVHNTFYANDLTGASSQIFTDVYSINYCGPSATFERSNLLRYSGVPINNSRTLSLDTTWVSDTEATVYVFLEHVKLSKAFLNNIVVSI
jgi:hypothetical protein